MTNAIHNASSSQLPHHSLIAYQVALQFLHAVLAAGIKDAKLRDEATRAAKGTCLNVAEGAARSSRADKARAYTIARGELVEAVAAVEIAGSCGDTSEAHVEACLALGRRVYALLTRLIRP
jgi:four helix bundle protein